MGGGEAAVRTGTPPMEKFFHRPEGGPLAIKDSNLAGSLLPMIAPGQDRLYRIPPHILRPAKGLVLAPELSKALR